MTIESTIKEGKESVIFSGLTKEKNWVAIKVYRTHVLDFKKISIYLMGDPRFGRISKNRRRFIYTWCKREFKNLQTAFQSGVNCPKPIAFMDNILIMSFIGDDGIAAPRLIDITPNNPQKVYDEIIGEMKKLSESGLVHGDLSAYNILFKDNPIIIDFSHATTEKNPIAFELLERDIKNINSYFSKFKIHLISQEILYKDLIKLLGAKKND